MPFDIDKDPGINNHDFDSERCQYCGMTRQRYYDSSWGCNSRDVMTDRPGGWRDTSDDLSDSMPIPGEPAPPFFWPYLLDRYTFGGLIPSPHGS